MLFDLNKDKLVKIAEALLEKEVLTSEEINKIVDGKPKTQAPPKADAPLPAPAVIQAQEAKDKEPGEV